MSHSFFTINIINPVIERRKSQILILHALSSLVIILLTPSAIAIMPSYNIYVITVFCTIAIAFFITPLILHKKNKLQQWNAIMRYSQSFMIGAIGVILLVCAKWFSGSSGVLWSIVFAFFAKTEQVIFNPQQMFINSIGIRYLTVFKSIIIAWNAIDRVVVRADYFSIFKKHGRYLQFEIVDHLSEDERNAISEQCKKLIEHGQASIDNEKSN